MNTLDAVWPIVGSFEHPVCGVPMSVALQLGAGQKPQYELVNIAMSNQRLRVVRNGPGPNFDRLVLAEAVTEGAGEALVEPTDEVVGERLIRYFDEQRRHHRAKPQTWALLQALRVLCLKLSPDVHARLFLGGALDGLDRANTLLHGITAQPCLVTITICRGTIEV